MNRGAPIGSVRGSSQVKSDAICFTHKRPRRSYWDCAVRSLKIPYSFEIRHLCGQQGTSKASASFEAGYVPNPQHDEYRLPLILAECLSRKVQPLVSRVLPFGCAMTLIFGRKREFTLRWLSVSEWCIANACMVPYGAQYGNFDQQRLKAG